MGNYTRLLSKPGYNIFIKGTNKTLHGTKNFNLKSDATDPTMLRSKLTADILEKSGLITIEVGYSELYINENYMGL